MTATGQLDLWGDDQRGSPNALLRSALFRAIQSSRPASEWVKIPIFSQDGFLIVYSGPELTQYYFSIWLQAAETIKALPLGGLHAFAPHAFLRGMGVTAEGGHNYDHLAESLTRLTKAHIHLKRGKSEFAGTLLSVFKRDQQTGSFAIRFSPEMLDLFTITGYTRLDWEERKRLNGKAIALSLHSYYSSHDSPYPVTVEFLYDLCGSRIKAMRSFRQKLKQAFLDLADATEGRLTATWEDDKVSVTNTRKPAEIE